MGRFVLASIVAAVGLTSWADGYLSVVGPKPVRVQPAPMPPAPAIFPTLPAAETNAAPLSEPVNAPEAAVAEEQQPTPPLSVSAGEPVTNFVSSILGPLTAMAEQAWLTPQMLIPYFRDIEGGTNRSKVLVGPVTFVPPVPTVTPSSKSTYQVLPLRGSPQ